MARAEGVCGGGARVTMACVLQMKCHAKIARSTILARIHKIKVLNIVAYTVSGIPITRHTEIIWTVARRDANVAIWAGRSFIYL